MLLYHCESCTRTKKWRNALLNELRMLNIKLIEKRIEEICKRSHEKPITTEIKKHHLNWLGHMLRLPDKTPAKLALKEHLRISKGNRGRPKHTWIRQINHDLKPIYKTMKGLTENDYE